MDLIDITDINNIDNDGTIIEYNNEKCNYKGLDKKKISGEGKIIYRDGRIYEGMCKNGHQNGEGELFDPNLKQKRRGIWKHGQRIKWLE